MSEPFAAVVVDMDGVLTDTARLHESAWKQTFDEFLAGYPSQPDFSSGDYHEHVDGKPRYEGAAAFLESRDLELPRGLPSDSPAEQTICGLGNRKNEAFLQLLERQSAEVFEDVRPALQRWRRGGLRLAVVSGSRNCRRVLASAGLLADFDVVVDGRVASEMGLDGKPAMLLEACRKLDLTPERCVLFEDALSGVRAGRERGFGLVVGVDRSGVGEQLQRTGAHCATGRIDRVRFVRRLPNALDCMEELRAEHENKQLVLFLDFDGTLSPIVDRPDDATMSTETRDVLRRLSEKLPLAIISGRDRGDVMQRVKLSDLLYAGSHGLDIAGRGLERTMPEAQATTERVRAAQQRLSEQLQESPGVVIERKRFSVAVHYRQVDDEVTLQRLDRCVSELAEEFDLRRREGEQVSELEPDVDWDKGRALRWLLEVLPQAYQDRFADQAHGEWFVLYMGDGETDEDAFASVQGVGVGVRVGEQCCDSLASYQLRSPDEVRLLLRLLDQSEAGLSK